MKHLRFSFDVISPYAYLAFERLPQVLEGVSHEVSYQPVLLAGLLQHWGQKGPAEIPPKRDWTYRQIAWLAHRHGVPMQMPAAHPFNPLALQRLLLATAPPGCTPGRWACERVFHHVWRDGADANEAERLSALRLALAPPRDPTSTEVKEELKRGTSEAAARGVFGVPSIEVDGRLFWGLDGLGLLGAYVREDPWFEAHSWDAAVSVPIGIQRKH